MAKLELVGVNKSYGDTVAVRDIDLVVEDNEFFCVFGPPSCGKTTILRLLLGLVAPDVGEVRIGDRVVNDVGPADRNLAMVFQNLALFPHMTVAENLRFPLVERKFPKGEIEARVREVADKLHIIPLLNKIPAHLSGGERQRVAVGRALVRDPVAFLMDEPIAALDARLREEMRVELKRLQRELKHTLVYVTHDQEEAMSVADRMAIMDNGEIRQTGTPEEIYNRPGSRYVAELIGAPPMNFIAGTLDRAGGRFVAQRFDYTTSLTGVQDGATAAAELGVRPEDIGVVRGSAPDAPEATVYEVEPLGAFTIVDLQAGETLLKAQIAGQPDFRPGEPVHLRIDPARCHLFDAETGDALRPPPAAERQSVTRDDAPAAEHGLRLRKPGSA